MPDVSAVPLLRVDQITKLNLRELALKRYALMAFLAVLAIWVAPALALPCDPNVMPMPEPQPDEAKASPVSTVERGCMTSVNARVSLIGTHIGPPVFTRSPKWGDVVRMDIGEPNPSRYSRIVCFQRKGDAAVQMGLYDITKKFCDGHIAGVSFTLKPPGEPTAGIGSPPSFRTLIFLPNGHMRFDVGPEINMRQLKSEIRRMAREHNCPDVHLNTANGGDYSSMAEALRLFQKYGCNDLGFRGLEK